MITKSVLPIAIGAAAILAAQPATAQIAQPAPAKAARPAIGTKITLSNDLTDFSGPYGTRRETTL